MMEYFGGEGGNARGSIPGSQVYGVPQSDQMNSTIKS